LKHTLPELPYGYDALDPYIDEETMRIHHTKHHQAYIDKYIIALEKEVALLSEPVEDILVNIQKVPENIRKAVINNGGGYANHTLFWQVMKPNGGGVPKGKLQKIMHDTFRSFEEFKNAFSETALSQFGSGWAWLVADDKKTLQVYSTSNQDSPLLKGHTPILGLDVWEHAYYLKYQNRRADYIEAWWNVVNWEKVGELFDEL